MFNFYFDSEEEARAYVSTYLMSQLISSYSIWGDSGFVGLTVYY